MVSEGIGSIFRRKDGKYFVYLPKDLAVYIGAGDIDNSHF